LVDYRQYYRALCKTTKRPVYIQTSGGARDVEPTVEFIVELARELPNFGYIKEEHDPLIPRMRAEIAHRPNPIKRVFCANRDAGLLYELRLGSDGTIIGGVSYADIFGNCGICISRMNSRNSATQAQESGGGQAPAKIPTRNPKVVKLFKALDEHPNALEATKDALWIGGQVSSHALPLHSAVEFKSRSTLRARRA
jgi:hypothetical protein